MPFSKVNELAISEVLDLEEITIEAIHTIVDEYATVYELDINASARLYRNLMVFEEEIA